MSDIFVQIASYRDNDIFNTIKNCIENAVYPERLHFGICLQHKKQDIKKVQALHKNIKIIPVEWQYSLGACWARHCIQNLYFGEDYTLQIDSHHRFVPKWDQLMIETLLQCPSENPILSTYVTSFDPQTNIRGTKSYKTIIDPYDFVKMPFPTFHPIISDGNLELGRFLSGHFLFTKGKFCNEIKYDPNLYFIGEEISLSARAWTSGYDFFIPDRILLWHEYTRKGRNKHWDDSHWKLIDVKSRNRVYDLLYNGKVEPFKLSSNDKISSEYNYGLGNIRTLKEYFDFIGINLIDKSMTSDCFYGKEPGNSPELFKYIELEVKIPKTNITVKNKDQIFFVRDKENLEEDFIFYNKNIIRFYTFGESNYEILYT